MNNIDSRIRNKARGQLASASQLASNPDSARQQPQRGDKRRSFTARWRYTTRRLPNELWPTARGFHALEGMWMTSTGGGISGRDDGVRLRLTRDPDRTTGQRYCNSAGANTFTAIDANVQINRPF